MPAPYRPEEIAIALIHSARLAGVVLAEVEVLVDDDARQWIIRGTAPDGRQKTLTFPYASVHGIYTPAEIAAHVVRGSWPFGR